MDIQHRTSSLLFLVRDSKCSQKRSHRHHLPKSDLEYSWRLRKAMSWFWRRVYGPAQAFITVLAVLLRRWDNQTHKVEGICVSVHHFTHFELAEAVLQCTCRSTGEPGKNTQTPQAQLRFEPGTILLQPTSHRPCALVLIHIHLKLKLYWFPTWNQYINQLFTFYHASCS